MVNGPTTKTAIRITRNAAWRIHSAQLPRMAAALAYRTIFALIPMLVIGVAVIGTLADKDAVESVVDRVFELTGIDRIVLTPPEIDENAQTVGPFFPMPTNSPAQRDAVEKAQAQAREEAELEAIVEAEEQTSMDRARIDSWIDSLVSGVEGEQGRLKAIGAAGVAALVYAALGFLIEIERAFNSIYHARDGRAWTRRFTNYTTLLVVGPIFLILTFWLAGQLSDALEGGANWLGLSIPILAEVIVRGTGIFISTLLFVLLYRVIPNARVHVRSATIGAFIAALLWELAKYGLVTYLSVFSGGVARLYGAIGLIPIFLLWIYITWMIVLFGLQCSFLIQHRRDVLADDPDRVWRVVDPAAALLIAVEAARRFSKGQTLSISRAALAGGVDQDLASGFLQGLVERDVLHAIEAKDTDQGVRYTLAAEPGKIPAHTALEAGFGLVGLSSGATQAMRDAQVQTLVGRTLADLAAEAGVDLPTKG